MIDCGTALMVSVTLARTGRYWGWVRYLQGDIIRFPLAAEEATKDIQVWLVHIKETGI